MSTAELEARQKRQVEELDKLQSALDDIKRRAAGPAGAMDEGTLINRVSG